MAIQTSCPRCRAEYRLPDTQKGKRVRCKGCLETFLVEDEDVPVLEEATAADLRKVRPRQEVEELPVLEEYDDRVRPSRPRTPPPPPRRRDEEEDFDDRPLRDEGGGGSSVPLILGAVAAILLLLGVAGGLTAFFVFRSSSTPDGQASTNPPDDRGKAAGPIVPPIDKGKGPGPIVPPDDKGKGPGPIVPPAGENKRTPPRDIRAALDRVGDADRFVRIVGLDYLAREPVDDLRREDVVRAIKPLLSERGQPEVRAAAARVMARYATKDHVAELIPLLDDTDLTVWRGAMDILAGVNDDQAAEALAKQLATPARAVFAAGALRKVGKRAEKFVVKYLHHHEFFTRTEASRLLQHYGTSEAMQLTQSIADLDSKETATKRSAVEWFNKHKPTGENQDKVSKSLEGLLTDSDLQVRRSAATALEQWATADSVPSMVAALKDQLLRASLIGTLGRLKDERALAALVECLATPEREASAKALIGFGKKAEPPMLVLLRSTDAQIRRAALNILAEVGTKDSLKVLQAYANAEATRRGGDKANAQLANQVIARIKARDR